ncbi:hypothetical protein AVEN_39115-1 [Araneus ventricosus]|uniref:Uncharacterized protein n=1 Tax=Araneus ventricosus TaxID=182803 RepID=A0A4Y2DEI2_ARAVE|nr:hypothetical protein AVEN_39115-1 [Araneus ventricosus]
MPRRKVEVSDIKRILVFDGYVTQALWLLWCSSTYLLSFISSQSHLLTMKTLVALVFLFLAILSVVSALPVLLLSLVQTLSHPTLKDVIYPENGCHTHCIERIWIKSIFENSIILR